LAGQLGKDLPDPIYGTPVLLTDDKNINNWLKPVPNQPLTFKMEQTGKPFDATLIPFYQTYQQHYSVYWDFSPIQIGKTDKQSMKQRKNVSKN